MRTTRAVLQVGPTPSEAGGIGSVLRAYAALPLSVRQSFTTSFRSGARLWSAGPLLRSARAVLKSGRGTVVHVHLSHWGSYVREGGLLVLAALLGHPTVATVHGSGFAVFAGRHPRVVRAVLGRASVVTVLGPVSGELVADLVPGVRCVVVPNPGLAAAPTPVPARSVVLFGGEVGTRKGVDVLLAAWPRVRQQCPDAELRIAGPVGDLFPRPVDGTTWLGVQDAARMRQELERCRVAVLPSRAEVQPMFLLEAMSLGRPVVATEVGEVAELVGEGGIVVPPADVDALTTALVQLLGDDRRAQECGTAAAARAAGTYSPPAVAARLDDVYAGLLPAAGS